MDEADVVKTKQISKKTLCIFHSFLHSFKTIVSTDDVHVDGTGWSIWPFFDSTRSIGELCNLLFTGTSEPPSMDSYPCIPMQNRTSDTEPDHWEYLFTWNCFRERATKSALPHTSLMIMNFGNESGWAQIEWSDDHTTVSIVPDINNIIMIWILRLHEFCVWQICLKMYPFRSR